MLHILRRVELDEYARFGVRCVFAHDSYPGRILVEVGSSTGVIGICNGIPHVFANRWKVVPREVSSQFLKLPSTFIPLRHTWIKLRCRGYRNDIGFIKAVHEDLLEVIVIPRVVYVRAGKRKRGPIPKERFNLSKAQSSSASVKMTNNIYTFKGQTFTECGYLKLSLRNSFDYYHTEIFPTVAQLDEFRACELISNSAMAQFIAKANSPFLNVGDLVRISTGDLQGLVAEVMIVHGTEIDVFILDNGICATIPSHFVQKYFRVGNQVIVKSGIHKDLAGWVVEVTEDTLTVADDADKTVRLFISLMFLSLTRANSDKFNCYLQTLITTRPILPFMFRIPTSPLNDRVSGCLLILTSI